MTPKTKVTAPMDFADLRSVPGFWYLGTPYSKYPSGLDEAFKDAARAAAHLVRGGVRVYSPIAHTHPVAIYGGIDPFDHDVWLPADRPFMDAACGLIVVKMPSWRESYGLKVEIDTFEAAGKPVKEMEWPL